MAAGGGEWRSPLSDSDNWGDVGVLLDEHEHFTPPAAGGPVMIRRAAAYEPDPPEGARQDEPHTPTLLAQPWRALRRNKGNPDARIPHRAATLATLGGYYPEPGSMDEP